MHTGTKLTAQAKKRSSPPLVAQRCKEDTGNKCIRDIGAGRLCIDATIGGRDEAIIKRRDFECLHVVIDTQALLAGPSYIALCQSCCLTSTPPVAGTGMGTAPTLAMGVTQTGTGVGVKHGGIAKAGATSSKSTSAIIG